MLRTVIIIGASIGSVIGMHCMVDTRKVPEPGKQIFIFTFSCAWTFLSLIYFWAICHIVLYCILQHGYIVVLLLVIAVIEHVVRKRKKREKELAVRQISDSKYEDEETYIPSIFSSGGECSAASSASKLEQGRSQSISKQRSTTSRSSISKASTLLSQGSSWSIHHSDIEICKDSDGNEIVLGKGGYGKVLRGIRHGVQDIAIKVSRVDKTSIYDSILSEADMMKGMQDKNVVHFYGICTDQNCLMVVMELMEGGDLESALLHKNFQGHFKWANHGRKIALDIIKGLVYIHSKNIIHRDIKLKNILLDDSLRVAKIADVGVARLLEEEEGLTYVGTQLYLAPEIRTGVYGLSADIYSFGVLLRALITGEIPRRSAPLRGPVAPEECPVSMVHLIERCLDENPGMNFPLRLLHIHI